MVNTMLKNVQSLRANNQLHHKRSDEVEYEKLIDLVSLFKGISTFRVYLSPKPSLWKKMWTWLRKRNKERNWISSNSAIRTNHIKARIDKTQQNRRCRLCGDRDETIKAMISECSKLAQKEYKTRHDWVGKVKFDHTNKWYIHNPTSILENDTHKLLWDFEIQTDHLISTRRPDLIIIKKERTCVIVTLLSPRITE